MNQPPCALLFLLQWHKRAAVRSKRGKTCTQLNQQDLRLTYIYIFSFWSPDTPATWWSRATDHLRLTVKLWDSSPLLWPLPPGSFMLILFFPVNAALWPQIEAMGRPLACVCTVYEVCSTQLHITLMEQREEPWGCQCSQQFWGHFRLRGHIFRSVIQWRPWETPAQVTHKIHNRKRTVQ